MAQNPEPNWLPERRVAKRSVRKMDPGQNEGGGSEPQVLEDRDAGGFWMTKAQNNPQGQRVLVNEFVSAALGRRFGAAVQPAAVLDIPSDIAERIKHGSGAAWATGPSFASELMDKAAVYAPDMLADASDPVGLAKVPVLDTWIGINDGRQARGQRVDTKYDIRAVDFGHSLGNPN